MKTSSSITLLSPWPASHTVAQVPQLCLCWNTDQFGSFFSCSPACVCRGRHKSVLSTTTVRSPSLLEEVPSSQQSSPLPRKRFDHPGWAVTICPGTHRAAQPPAAPPHLTPPGSIRRSALPYQEGTRGGSGRAPLPAHIHGFTAEPWQGFHFLPPPPLMSRFWGQHGAPDPVPLHLPGTAQAPPRASPAPRPGQVPSAGAPLRAKRLPLSPEISGALSAPLPPLLSLFSGQTLTAAPEPPQPSPPHTARRGGNPLHSQRPRPSLWSRRADSPSLPADRHTGDRRTPPRRAAAPSPRLNPSLSQNPWHKPAPRAPSAQICPHLTPRF